MMSNKKRLVVSIIQFLNEELVTGACNEDAAESLEVAVQCLESSYNVEPGDSSLLPTKSLMQIYSEAVADDKALPQLKEATDDEKSKAEVLKNEGNNHMKAEKYTEALDCYTKAVALDGRNPVYYCNRAAAYSKLENNSKAIEDCDTAILLDPKYSKAYGRKGLALSAQKCYNEAIKCYNKAVELEPENETYKNNLKVAMDKRAESGGETMGGLGNLFGGAGGMPDFSAVLSNPMLMNMATQLMQSNNMEQMFSMLAQNQGGAPGAAADPPPGAGGVGVGGVGGGGGEGNDAPGAQNPSLDAFIHAGQRLAEQIQQSNPELVEQLRQQMTGSGGGNSGNDPSRQQPPAPDNT